MKTVGIISEYNPFHNGHKYHIEAAKEACSADHCVCIMSGSFVQRGEPSIFDKWTRAEMAVLNGADLVIELPVIYACQPAEIFALGAIKILNALGIIDFICFGSELGDTDALHTLARLLHNEPVAFRLLLKKQLELGVSYPRAVSTALSSYLGSESEAVTGDILGNPNNVLGIEYIKALMALHSNIEPVAVKRMSSDHNDTGIAGSIASATAIRHEIKKNGITGKVRQAMPDNCITLIEASMRNGRHPLFLDSFSDLLLYKLRTLGEAELGNFLNAREGIENRLKKFSLSCTGSEELLERVKTKRYTRTYLQRLLCHILLDMNKQDVSIFKAHDCPAYIRVLAFNQKGTGLLKKINSHSVYPVISKVADFCSRDERINRMFSYDLLATNVYSLGYKEPLNKKGLGDYLRSPIYHR